MRRRALLLAALAAGACGDDDGTPATPDADIAGLTYTPCAAADHVGGFEVVLETDYTAVQGQVFDGVPPTERLDVLTTEGPCQMLKAPTYACDPACTPGNVCGEGDVCVPYPLAHTVGDVSVVGLAAAVGMEPRPPNFFYTNVASLPHPGFTAGAAIAMSTTGGDYAAFSLRGWGISPLELPVTQVTVETGQPLALTWTPPPEAGPAKILITLNINGHGLIGQHLECEVDDTGSFTIPATLITALVDAGLSGFPTLKLTRSSADSTQIAPGCVDFRVHTSKVLEVVIPGLISCDGNEDCPMGQTCQGDLTCG